MNTAHATRTVSPRNRQLERAILNCTLELVVTALTLEGRRLSVGELLGILRDSPLSELKPAIALGVRAGRLCFTAGVCSLPEDD